MNRPPLLSLLRLLSLVPLLSRLPLLFLLPLLLVPLRFLVPRQLLRQSSTRRHHPRPIHPQTFHRLPPLLPHLPTICYTIRGIILIRRISP